MPSTVKKTGKPAQVAAKKPASTTAAPTQKLQKAAKNTVVVSAKTAAAKTQVKNSGKAQRKQQQQQEEEDENDDEEDEDNEDDDDDEGGWVEGDDDDEEEEEDDLGATMDWEDLPDASDASDDDENDDEEEVDGEDGEEWDDVEGEDADEDAAEKEGDDAGEPEKKRVKNEAEEEKQRASRAEQRQLLKERKAAKPHGTMIQQAKKLWETLRLKKIDPKVRAEHMAQMMELITGHIQEVTFKHDAARMIQCCLKYGNQTQRNTIASELKGSYLTLSKSQYGKFIVSKILNFCPNHRSAVIQEFYGKVRACMKHKDAAIVLEEAYSQFANAAQRTALMEEFYGPEFALFKTSTARTLSDLLTANPDKKTSILTHLSTTLTALLEKSAATIGPHTLIHRALLDYLTHADPSTTSSILSLLHPHIPYILHTREGARVSQIAIASASPKDRKTILKSFKGLFGKICKEQYGHTVLLSALESVDDTVLMMKALWGEVSKAGVGATDVSEVWDPVVLGTDRYASRVMLFLLTGRDGGKKYQPGFVLDELKGLDGVRATTCKKEDSLKRREWIEACADGMIELAAKECGTWVRSRFGVQILAELLRCEKGDKSKLIASLASLTTGTITSYASSVATAPTKTALTTNQKLAASLKSEKQDKVTDPDAPDMSTHVLINRVASFAFKNMISTCPELATAVSNTLKPNVTYWVDACVKDPFKMQGPSFTFIAIVEGGSEEAKASFKDGLKGSDLKKMVAAVRSVNRVVPEETKTNAKKGKKRGVDERDGKRAEGGASVSGIEKLLVLLGAK